MQLGRYKTANMQTLIDVAMNEEWSMNREETSKSFFCYEG